MIDSHCHLADKKFYSDLEDVLERAKEAVVEKRVAIAQIHGISLEEVDTATTKNASMNVMYISAFFLFVFFLPTDLIAHSVFRIDVAEKGFDPQRIEIIQGTTVVFRNIGSKEHWPASNIHPDHTVYPGSNIRKCGTDEEDRIFDSCRGVSSGEEYSFTFTKAGRWRFHDHLFPDLNGEIVVIGDNDAGSDANGDYSSQKNVFFRAYDTLMRWIATFFISPKKIEKELVDVHVFDIAYDHPKLTSLVQAIGEKRVLGKLLEESGQGFTRDCHQQAHQVGVVSYRLYGADSFTRGDISCQSGFYHGVMGDLMSEWGGENVAENTMRFCGSLNSGYEKFECLHGVGHGLMAYVDYDLPSALDYCEGLHDDWWKGSCYGGVFHENIAIAAGLGVVPGHETKWVDSDNPYFPCDILEGDEGREFECYQVQTALMLKFTDYDFSAVSKLCTEAPERNRAACFRSLGRDASGYHLRDPVKLKALCSEVSPGDDKNHCIIGAENVIIDFFGAELQNQATDLCRILDEPEKSVCYSTLIGRLKDLFDVKEERDNICRGFEEEYKDVCLQ